jgi:double zinc ribbon protein
MSKTCSRCSATLDADAMFCPSCSAPTISETNLTCPKCGRQISAEMRFCKYCSADLAQSSAATQRMSTPPSMDGSKQTEVQSPEDKRMFISPAGAAIAVICFFLPWVEVSCNSFGGRQIQSVSGGDIGGLLWIVFVAAVAIIVAVLVYRAQNQIHKARPIVILCSIAAFVVMFIQYIRFSNETSGQQTPFGRIRPEDLGFSFSLQIGGIGTLLGFALALIGSAFMKPRLAPFSQHRTDRPLPTSRPLEARATESYDQATATLHDVQVNVSEDLQKLKTSAAGTAKQVHQWYIKRDVPGWIRRHALLLGGIAASVVALIIFYYVFIKPSPTADAKTAAVAYTECQAVYKAKVDSAYQTFIDQFTAQNYRIRADAGHKLEELLSGDRQVYNTCSASADTKYNEFSVRYRNDSDDFAAFSKTFAENNGGRKTAQEIEQSSSLFAVVNEKILSIRAPVPDSDRIAKDLIGQSMDGWNFSYASEFKGIKIIRQKLDGDSLVLRTHLNLEDYNTKEAYLAVLDLNYGLNSNGEWAYNGLTQLLHDKADVNYFMSDEVFLVGRWRWPDNYTAYSADGSWSGKWDNGSESTGTWRIVKGNLVLTRDGSNWFSGKIVQFSKDELLVGETNPVRAERAK